MTTTIDFLNAVYIRKFIKLLTSSGGSWNFIGVGHRLTGNAHGVRVQHLNPVNGDWNSKTARVSAAGALQDSTSGKAYLGESLSGVLYIFEAIVDQYHDYKTTNSQDASCSNCAIYDRCPKSTGHCFDDVLDKFASYFLKGDPQTYQSI